jgi:chitinase
MASAPAPIWRPASAKRLIRRLWRLAAIVAACLPCGAVAAPAGPLSGPILMTIHESWRERPATGPYATTLAAVPGYVKVLGLAFASPAMTYHGDLDLSGTGLSYQFSGQVLRDSIALLKKRNPRTQILLSVGGGNEAPHWPRLNETAIAQLVRDLGLDGVDVDFEPTNPGCVRGPTQKMSCASDADWIAYVQRMRRVLPRPYLLAVDGWSVGAYGEAGFKEAQPTGSRYTGEMLGLLRSPVAAQIDLVIIMGYDTRSGYDPMTAVAAYRAHWQGPMVLGVETAFKGGRGPYLTLAETEDLARRANHDWRTGMLVYSLLEPVDPSVIAREHNGGRKVIQAACRGLGLSPCEPTMP